MMSHLILLPILIPFFVGSVMLILPLRIAGLRTLSLLATLSLIVVAVMLLRIADSGELQVYSLGNWIAPFGIVLVLDRLAALMLAVTAVLAGGAMLYAIRGDDRLGRFFHPLFQFQLMGINGAFLTGDLFNLFVFFEILLISSYVLLVHGGGGDRIRSGMHYVVLNLVGSSLFLIAAGLLYGAVGTLNMADLAARIMQSSPEQMPLIAAGGLLLLVVFALKAALLPLYFWLPRAYASAAPPVAALFAVMTKVGIYSIIRFYTLVFGEQAGPLADMVLPWLWPLALVTLLLGTIGALAAVTLQGLLAYMIVVSVGTMLAGYALGNQAGLSGVLFYLVHSTWIIGGLFLLADMIGLQRGRKGTLLVQGPLLRNPMLLGGLFFAASVSVAGLPPLSGFLGKILILQAAPMGWVSLALWGTVLTGGLLGIIALSRAGSTLFWQTGHKVLGSAELDGVRLMAVVLLLAGSPLLVLFAQPVLAYMDATAAQLHDIELYLQIVRQGDGI